MFPTMDPISIEHVLRVNNGGVDDTIDQLLAMTASESPLAATLPKTLEDDVQKPGQECERVQLDEAGSSGLGWEPGAISSIPHPHSISSDLLGLVPAPSGRTESVSRLCTAAVPAHSSPTLESAYASTASEGLPATVCGWSKALHLINQY